MDSSQKATEHVQKGSQEVAMNKSHPLQVQK